MTTRGETERQDRTSKTRSVLITGGCGFIGSTLIDRLVEEGNWNIVAIDNLDPFYAVERKRQNLAPHLERGDIELLEADCADSHTRNVLADRRWDVIVHVAAKAGVRPSLEDPASYYRANVQATDEMLRLAAASKTERFILISSSSVYGVNPRTPWSEEDLDLRPISPYAASKVAAEAVARVYSHLHGIEVAALRLFTVFGPRQRPDLAIHRFAELMAAGEPITLFGDGTTVRDYTFVEDIVDGIRSAMDAPMRGFVPINLGGGRPVKLLDLVEGLQRALGIGAEIVFTTEQAGDVPATHASIERARRLLGYEPKTSLERGLELFARWFEPQDRSG